ncbi:uncharacterized protein [Haliotis asinina]|uniref:uncharacterized protein n=1 Tax=Haliotis asinina TaxID=109174 RepID=UPI003531E47C
MLYVQDFQQPYIVASETPHVDRSVTLSCFSVFELHSGGDVRLTVSTKWRRNGLLVSDRIRNNVTEENHTWNGHRRYHRSTLTVSDTAKGDNFQCQAVVGLAVVSGWSEVYQQVKQPGSFQDYTVVHEGQGAFVTWKMPMADEDFFIEAPRYGRLCEVKFPRVYINNPYRVRVNLTKVTTSADSAIVQFWLHNATSEDAGKYSCFTMRHDPIPSCHHMLYVQGKHNMPQHDITS